MTDWLDIPGLVNARDLGGTPTRDGRRVRPGTLLRSDNLQGLAPGSVRALVDEWGVSDVVDLRTGVEVAGEGPGPMTKEPGVTIHHLSLYPEGADETGIPDEDDPVPALPWQDDVAQQHDEHDTHEDFVAAHYLAYFDRRPDSLLTALRVITDAEGAVLVHCAAGKDRTGTVIAIALSLAGVDLGDIAADYAASNERMSEIIARLRASSTYEADLEGQTEADQATPSDGMRRLFDALERRFGGLDAWLATQGWTADDTARLRARLLTPST